MILLFELSLVQCSADHMCNMLNLVCLYDVSEAGEMHRTDVCQSIYNNNIVFL